MLVKDIMTADVKVISSDASVKQAAKLMADFRIGCLIVVDKKILAGIITERDILRDVVSKDKVPSKTRVKEIMTKEVFVVKPGAEIEDAAKLMTEHQVKRLPVVTGHQIVGIISAVDIVAAEPEMMEQIAKIVLLPVKKRLAAG